jgi:hypothetical protein
MKKGWFGPKEIGYGVGPKTWQGWAATVAFGLGFAGWTGLFQQSSTSVSKRFAAEDGQYYNARATDAAALE